MEGKRNGIMLFLHEKNKHLTKQLMSKCADTARTPFRKWSSTVSDK